jgi:hypothetical protein
MCTAYAVHFGVIHALLFLILPYMHFTQPVYTAIIYCLLMHFHVLQPQFFLAPYMRCHISYCLLYAFLRILLYAENCELVLLRIFTCTVGLYRSYALNTTNAHKLCRHFVEYVTFVLSFGRMQNET